MRPLRSGRATAPGENAYGCAAGGAAVQAGGPLTEALNSTVITGANGDERGDGPADREGVSPDDMCFGRCQDLRLAPVEADLLSTDLPAVPQ